MERYYKSLSLTSDFYHKWLFGDVKQNLVGDFDVCCLIMGECQLILRSRCKYPYMVVRNVHK